MRRELRQRDVVQIFLVLSDLQDEDVFIAIVSDHVVVNSRRNPVNKTEETRMAVAN